jgi:hypothetical protein
MSANKYKGTPEEECSKGVVGKYDFLAELHKTLHPKLYLEIGIQKGKSLSLCSCECIGIDPEPRIPSSFLEGKLSLFKMKSSEFFNVHSPKILAKRKPDLVFIDGMHLIEYALLDFINVEKYSKKSTVVIMDDIFPAHPVQAERIRRTQKWTGDVWKIVPILQGYRPDLELHFLDTAPTGMLKISKLDKKNGILSDVYSEVIKQYADILVPDSVINRDLIKGMKE